MTFSLFGGKNRKDLNKNGAKSRYGALKREETADNSTIAKFSPRSFDDVEVIIDCLLGGEPAIVSLSSVSENTAQRVVDILSGATYAIGGNLSRLEDDLYVFTPSGVKTK